MDGGAPDDPGARRWGGKGCLFQVLWLGDWNYSYLRSRVPLIITSTMITTNVVLTVTLKSNLPVRPLHRSWFSEICLIWQVPNEAEFFLSLIRLCTWIRSLLPFFSAQDNFLYSIYICPLKPIKPPIPLLHAWILCEASQIITDYFWSFLASLRDIVVLYAELAHVSTTCCWSNRAGGLRLCQCKHELSSLAHSLISSGS